MPIFDDPSQRGELCTPAEPLTGDEQLQIIQNFIDRRTTTGAIAALAGAAQAGHAQSLSSMTMATGRTQIMAGPIAIPAGQTLTTQGTGRLKVI